ncbi:uncharacterized protein C1orf127 homolog [Hypomesus transpacificus]|uniref:uncharacterized protein C1orf127 homolog n=1 Tax=Hypomesus transpacificus TaxID=137520 RepID=UPI001F07207A|nr:uncharacterized protein C1orf127 homolog [Hypomesus transpacificus]
MAKARFGIFQSFFVVTLISVLPIEAILKRHRRDWMDNSPATFREGDLECFSDYMEMWIHRMRIEGLRLWLSGAMRIQVVNLGSLDRLNSQLSACGFALHNDPDKNYIFRVMYTGCLVQQQYGNNVLVLNLAKGIQRFGGRTQNFIMKCPLVSAPSNTEHIQCDSDYIQVTRQIPQQDSWNNELQWSLALRGSLIVALEDASLIQLNIDKIGTSLTLQGKRSEIMSPVTVLEKIGEFLALKLVSGQYAYSMEATCPNVSQISAEETVLHIFKRRMGLTKRGSFESDTFTLSNVSVDKTDVFTVHENRDFVQLIIPTALILQTKPCTTDQELLQPFYRVKVQLTFKETNHQMYWIMENSFPCTVSGTNAPIPTLRPTLSSSTSPAEAYTTGSETTGDPSTTLKPTVSYPTSSTDVLMTLDDDQITTTTATRLPTLSYPLSMPEAYTTAPVTNQQRLPVTRDEITRTPKPTLPFSTPTREAFTAYRTGSGTDMPIATAPVDLTTISIPNPLEAALSSSTDVYTTAPAKPPGTSTHLHLSPDPPVEAVTWTHISTSYPPDPATTTSDSNTYTSNVTPLDLHGNEATRNTTEAADVGGAGAQGGEPQGVTPGSAGTRHLNQTESHSPQVGNGTQGMDFHSNSGTTESNRAVTEAMFQVGFQ